MAGERQRKEKVRKKWFPSETCSLTSFMFIDSIISETRVRFFFALACNEKSPHKIGYKCGGFQPHESICNGMDCALKVEQTNIFNAIIFGCEAMRAKNVSLLTLQLMWMHFPRIRPDNCNSFAHIRTLIICTFRIELQRLLESLLSIRNGYYQIVMIFTAGHSHGEH